MYSTTPLSSIFSGTGISSSIASHACSCKSILSSPSKLRLIRCLHKVVNDDGPPSNQSSPYVHSFVATLQEKGHTVSVVLPHIQRSWIGKAHFVGQLIKPTYFRPGTLHTDDGTLHEKPMSDGEDGEEWILVDGTPATCTQLGLHHFFKDRPPVDLVVSGPNYGRNSTTLFSLSSGTVGGAMEAATFKKKAIALSYAFFTRDHDPKIIAAASAQSVKLVEYLYHNWGSDVELYSINVPLVERVEGRKVFFTSSLENYWKSGSTFEEVDPDAVGETPDERETQIRRQTGTSDNTGSTELDSKVKPSRHKHRHFKWAPKFADVHKSVEESEPGNDGWAIKEHYTRLASSL